MKKVLDHKCLACGSKIEFNPKTQKWNCVYCHSKFNIDDFGKTHFSKEHEIIEVYRCPDCNAEIIADKNTSATFCIYCGNTAILKDKLEGKFRPQGIIPFTVTKEDAIFEFQKHIRKKILASKTFLKNCNVEKITGIYIPYWVNDLEVDVKFNGYGYKNPKYDPITSTYSIEKVLDKRHLKVDFENIPIDGSIKLDNEIMFNIFPYDMKKIQEYHHAYLSGFFAEKYDDNLEKNLATLKEKSYSTVDKAIKDSVQIYNEFSLIEKNIKISNIKSKYILVPVWMINIKYKNKIYPFVMNGQTKEFVGDIPISNFKMFLLVILTLLFVNGFINYFYGLEGFKLVIGIIISLIIVSIFLEKHNTVKPFIILDRFYDFKKIRTIEKSEKLLDIIQKRR